MSAKVQSLVRVDQIDDYLRILYDRVKKIEELENELQTKYEKLFNKSNKTKDEKEQLKSFNADLTESEMYFKLGNDLIKKIQSGLPKAGELYDEKNFKDSVFRFIVFMNESNALHNLKRSMRPSGGKKKFDETITVEDYQALE